MTRNGSAWKDVHREKSKTITVGTSSSFVRVVKRLYVTESNYVLVLSAGFTEVIGVSQSGFLLWKVVRRLRILQDNIFVVKPSSLTRNEAFVSFLRRLKHLSSKEMVCLTAFVP